MQPHLRTRVQSRRGVDTFTWDHENRLTQSVVGGVTSSSVYYGNGVRRSHTVNGVTTTYTYDVVAGLPVVLQDGTNTLVYGLDLISTTDAGGTQRYFSYDGLGSVTDLTDGTGAVTDTYSYDIFGAVRARTGTNASPWKFTGEQEDGTTGDTGYMYLRARYMEPATGRFISKDPIEFDQRYVYVTNNPTTLVDRTGKAAESAPGLWWNEQDEEWQEIDPACIGEDACGGGPGAFGRMLRIPTWARPTSFNSFSGFKKAYGPAGTDMHWHHIVEQNPANLRQFGSRAIHNVDNLMQLDAGIHRQVSGYYSSKQDFTGGSTVRQWLSTQSFEAQRAFGLDYLRNNFGITP